MAMPLFELLQDPTLNAQNKTKKLSALLLDKTIRPEELIAVAKTVRKVDLGNCMEALEYATRENTLLVTRACLDFATQCLSHQAPRVRWESAKVIGNIAPLFPNDLEPAIHQLLENTQDSGTVVRWSAAFALGEIIRLNLPVNQALIPRVGQIIEREAKKSIQKIYQTALKKTPSYGKL